MIEDGYMLVQHPYRKFKLQVISKDGKVIFEGEYERCRSVSAITTFYEDTQHLSELKLTVDYV